MKPRRRPHLTLLLLIAALWGCEPAPEAIRFGEDACDHCKMIIMDQKFGGELVSEKGKIYKFDALECLAAFYARETVPAEQVHSLWMVPFNDPGTLTEAGPAVYLHSETLRSPMGMNLAGFSDRAAARKMQEQYGGELLDWKAVIALVRENWLENHPKMSVY